MTDLVLRPPGEDESEAVAAVVNARERALYGANAVTPDELLVWWTAPDLDREQDVRVVERAGELVGYGDVVRRPGTPPRWWIDIRNLPGAEDAAAALLDWAERRVPRTDLLRAYVQDGADDYAAAVEARDFRRIRSSYRMRIDLDLEPEPPAWPDGIRVRTFRDEDTHAVYEAHQESFADHWEFVRRPYEDWVHYHLRRPTFDPKLWFLAVDGDEIAGVALCCAHTSGEPGLGLVDELGVRPAWRRRGLGLALLGHAFGEFRQRGYRTVVLGVDAESTTGAVRLYERAGMSIERRNDQYEKVRA